MIIEIKVPSPGESISEVQIASWLVENGETVEKDQDIVEIDSDKATLPLASPQDGKITILVKEGETVEIGTVIATVDTEQKSEKKKRKKKLLQKSNHLKKRLRKTNLKKQKLNPKKAGRT